MYSYPDDEEFKKLGYVSRNWYNNLDDYVLKWYYKINDSTPSFFFAHKKNRLGAESRLQVMICSQVDGKKTKDILMYINGESQKDEGFLFTKKNLIIDSVFKKFDTWAEDAPKEWKIEAEKSLGNLFRTQIRTTEIETETEFESGIGAELKAGIPIVKGETKVRHKKRKSLK